MKPGFPYKPSRISDGMLTEYRFFLRENASRGRRLSDRKEYIMPTKSWCIEYRGTQIRIVKTDQGGVEPLEQVVLQTLGSERQRHLFQWATGPWDAGAFSSTTYRVVDSGKNALRKVMIKQRPLNMLQKAKATFSNAPHGQFQRVYHHKMGMLSDLESFFAGNLPWNEKLTWVF